MRLAGCGVLLAAFVFGWASGADAQVAINPSGHWEGAIHAPGTELNIQIDLVRRDTGTFDATFSVPEQDLVGYPLTGVAVDGAAVRFELKANLGGVFSGTLAADGQSIAGTFVAETPQGVLDLPFDMVRRGDARMAAVVSNAAIRRELEGTWNGVLEVSGVQMRLVVRLRNEADGTSTGTVANLDQGNVEIPIGRITLEGPSLMFDVPVVGGRYAGSVNAASTEVAGTWTQGGIDAPVTFRRD
jgi:hypothetical protein